MQQCSCLYILGYLLLFDVYSEYTHLYILYKYSHSVIFQFFENDTVLTKISNGVDLYPSKSIKCQIYNATIKS